MNSCSVQSPFFEESRSISAIPSRSDITVIITSRTIVQLSQCRSFIDDPSSNASKIRINNLYTDALCCAGCAQFRSNNNRIGRVGGFIRARLCMQIGKRLSNHDPHEARVSVSRSDKVEGKERWDKIGNRCVRPVNAVYVTRDCRRLHVSFNRGER